MRCKTIKTIINKQTKKKKTETISVDQEKNS